VLEMWHSPNNDIGIYLPGRKHSWTKNAFWDLKNKKWRKWCKFVSPFLLITPMAYMWLQWTPKVQIKYFMFDWSNYRQFVLNSGWKRDSPEIIIFGNVNFTWGKEKIKTYIETWITSNNVYGVCLFHLS
jgi:hypothetical protein